MRKVLATGGGTASTRVLARAARRIIAIFEAIPDDLQFGEEMVNAKEKINIFGFDTNADSIDWANHHLLSPKYPTTELRKKAYPNIEFVKMVDGSGMANYGSGTNPEIAQRAWEKLKPRAEKRISESDFVFHPTGLAGFTGTTVFPDLLKMSQRHRKWYHPYTIDPCSPKEISFDAYERRVRPIFEMLDRLPVKYSRVLARAAFEMNLPFLKALDSLHEEMAESLFSLMLYLSNILTDVQQGWEVFGGSGNIRIATERLPARINQETLKGVFEKLWSNTSFNFSGKPHRVLLVSRGQLSGRDTGEINTYAYRMEKEEGLSVSPASIEAPDPAFITAIFSPNTKETNIGQPTFVLRPLFDDNDPAPEEPFLLNGAKDEHVGNGYPVVIETAPAVEVADNALKVKENMGPSGPAAARPQKRIIHLGTLVDEECNSGPRKPLFIPSDMTVKIGTEPNQNGVDPKEPKPTYLEKWIKDTHEKLRDKLPWKGIPYRTTTLRGPRDN